MLFVFASKPTLILLRVLCSTATLCIAANISVRAAVTGHTTATTDSDGTSARKGAVTTGHAGTGGLRGLATHPIDPDVYCSAGSDRCVFQVILIAQTINQ
jgi:hypothetical protein